MISDFFLVGEKVLLIPSEAERDSKIFAGWRTNSEYLRLMDEDLALQFSIEQLKKMDGRE